jgi:ketosteroid isomerase-like protein
MSQENVEVVCEGVARFAARDIAGLAELYSPDAFVIAPEGWPEGGRFEGRDAVMRQFARVQEEWGSQSMRVERERSGGDWVVAKLIWNAEGLASGVPLMMSIVGAYRLEAGRIAEIRFFWDFDEALEAVGLRE